MSFCKIQYIGNEVLEMLVLPIKKKWFDMILSGEKKEEYREIKPYYDSRLNKKVNFCESTGYGYYILLRNG
jgi:hypothetical protein